jgi:hypothetical protein
MRMDEEVDNDMRVALFAFLSAKDSEYLYHVARDWNWDNGTWLPEWIVQQRKCTRATAQLIFWRAEPESFLPREGIEAWGAAISQSPRLYNLVKLILANWKAGLYARDHAGLLRRLTGVRQDRFWGDGNKFYARGQIGWFNDANPVHHLESYRKAEASCNRGSLPWSVPDDLGHILIEKTPQHGKYELSEGFPDEFLQHYETHAR